MKYDLKDLISHPSLAFSHRIRPPQSGQVEGSPCLLLLHGVGSNEIGLIDLAAQQDPRLTVILVRAPIQFGPMQFGFFQVRFTETGPVINAEQAEKSRQLLISFIERLPGLYGIDAKRVWIAGFSQGGILSASVGLTRPEKVAGFGVLCGRILPEIAPITGSVEQLEHLGAFVAHGAHDSKLTVEFARSAQRLLSEKGMRFEYQEYAADHELTAEMQWDFRDWLALQIETGR